MTAEWIAGNVRATALLARRAGAARAREIAAQPSLENALHLLADGPYHRDVRPGHTLAEAQQGIASSLLWHLRVLAGWQPRAGSEAVRVLAGWFEVSNVCEHARVLAGHPADQPYHLGRLATAWTRLAATSSLPELRGALRDSIWGDPGGDTPSAIALGTQLGWAYRVSTAVPDAATWAAGGAALLIARHRFLLHESLSGPALRRAESVIGADALAAGDIAGFAARLPVRARWSLADVDSPDALWRAEAAWWTRVERDGFGLLLRPRFGPARVIGTVVVLAADARRCRAALELAAHGGRPLEAFDAVA